MVFEISKRENQKFDLGQIVATAGINAVIEKNEIFKQNVQEALQFYVVGNWGVTSKDDAEMNDEAIDIKNPNRILAVYNTCVGNIWIITEWDRSVTTILFPSEY